MREATSAKSGSWMGAGSAVFGHRVAGSISGAGPGVAQIPISVSAFFVLSRFSSPLGLVFISDFRQLGSEKHLRGGPCPSALRPNLSSFVKISIPPDTVPALSASAGDRASLRFLEFSAANIRNPHTRRA
jgi:hypothetical protein